MIEQLTKIHPEVIQIRRHFHINPELSFKEEKTPAYIAEYLNKLGIEVHKNVGGRGVIGIIKGDNPGKTVALRADFDALPILDEKDVPYKSQVPGVMHACGHDAHAASLLGIANVASKNKHLINGEIRLIFQFAEEVLPGGAISMIKDGCLNGVDAIFGTHVVSHLPVGQYGYRAGVFMGIPDSFTIVVQGKGGHGASPHQTVDPIVTGAALIGNLQQIVSRRVNPLHPAVVTVGQFNAGKAFNVIADTATIIGTVRTMDKKVQDTIITELERIIKGTCDVAGAKYTLDYVKGYPALINHEKETDLVKTSLSTIVDSSAVVELDPTMGGEDFAYYLQKVPGCFFNTGAGNKEKGITIPHHHPKFDIDENALLYASKGLLNVAMDYLSS